MIQFGYATKGFSEVKQICWKAAQNNLSEVLIQPSSHEVYSTCCYHKWYLLNQPGRQKQNIWPYFLRMLTESRHWKHTVYLTSWCMVTLVDTFYLTFDKEHVLSLWQHLICDVDCRLLVCLQLMVLTDMNSYGLWGHPVDTIHPK